MTDWTHKLVKTENLSVEKLLQMAHPENAREHPEHQLEATEELIETIGLIDEIKVNINSGWINHISLRCIGIFPNSALL